MEICCLSRSSDSVSSALCCGLCLSVGPRWDSGWTVLQIGTNTSRNFWTHLETSRNIWGLPEPSGNFWIPAVQVRLNKDRISTLGIHTNLIKVTSKGNSTHTREVTSSHWTTRVYARR
eukprot:jgi/Chrzof1/5479/Cz16g04250.t1